MKGKIDIQPIQAERLKKGFPAYFYEKGYLFDRIDKVIDINPIDRVHNKKELWFGVDNVNCTKEYVFPAEEASEFIFKHENKVYPLDPSQWAECSDNDWYGDRNKELEFKVNDKGFAEIIIEPVKIGATERGFSLGEFKDDYGHSCSIQMSSVATRRCIWLGVDDVKPQIMASQAKQFGVQTNETTGWVHYPIPEEVCLHNRMHLTREDVKKLLPLLNKFAETGEL